MKTTLETSGEDVKSHLKLVEKMWKTTLEPSGEDVKTTLKTSGEDEGRTPLDQEHVIPAYQHKNYL